VLTRTGDRVALLEFDTFFRETFDGVARAAAWSRAT